MNNHIENNINFKYETNALFLITLTIEIQKKKKKENFFLVYLLSYNTIYSFPIRLFDCKLTKCHEVRKNAFHHLNKIDGSNFIKFSILSYYINQTNLRKDFTFIRITSEAV